MAQDGHSDPREPGIRGGKREPDSGGREPTMEVLLEEIEQDSGEAQPQGPDGWAGRPRPSAPPPVASPSPRPPASPPVASPSPRPPASPPAASPPPRPSASPPAASHPPRPSAPPPVPAAAPRPSAPPPLAAAARARPAPPGRRATSPRPPPPSPASRPPRRETSSAPRPAVPPAAVPPAAVPPAADPPATQPTSATRDAEIHDPSNQDARQLIQACETELTRNPDARRAGRLHYEIARLYEGPLRDLRRAAAHYQEALQRHPEHLPTIRGGRRVLIARKNYQAALPLFEAEARITSDPVRKAALYLAKGRLLEDVLGQRDDARQPYATASELDRSDASILKALEQTQFEAGAWDALERTLERAANAVSSDARHRAALIVERARLVETRKGDVDAAIELYETALKLDSTTHDAVQALKRLHHAQRRWRDLIRVLELEAQQARDPSVRTMALYRIGRLHAERLGNRDEALTALERAAREAPRDPLILEELARLYEAAERWDALVEALQSLVDATRSAEERVGLLHRMGQLYEEKLDQEDAAIHCYEAARRVQPAFVPALQALGKIYTRREDWEALIRVHLGEAEDGEDARRRAAAHVRVADVLEEQLGRPEDAIEHYARALSLVPGYAPAFKALVRLLSTARRWRELIELYERAVDLSKLPDQTIAHLMKIGSIYEDALGEHTQAAHTYRRILDTDASHLGAIHALQRSTERAGRWEEHVEALQLEIERIRDPQETVPLLHRSAEVLDDKLGDRAGALERLRRALTMDPKHAPSLSRLGTIHHRLGRWEDLLDVYRRELELAPRAPSAVSLLQKMAELCELRIGRDDDAIGYYRRILDLDATYGPALHSVERILRERGDYGELVKVLELELSGLRDPEARARAAFRVGEVYEEQLDDLDRAIAAYEQALQADAAYRPALDALGRLRAVRKAWSPLAADLERDATNATDPGLAVAGLLRQGELWAEHLNEPRRAIRCYERVLEQEPAHLGALVALERLYRRVGSWEPLAGVYATEAQVFTDRGARVAALRELARLQQWRGTGSAEDLRLTLEQILETVPDDAAALEGLEHLALDGGDRGLLASLDEKLAAHAEDPTLRAAHQTRLAESLEAAGDSRSLEAYRTALTFDPESIGATRGLSRIAERMDDPTALAEAARREAQVAHDGETAARLLVRSARVRTERLGDVDGAVSDLERALELFPDHAEAAERLGEVLRHQGQLARLADLLARAAASSRSAERMASLWHEVAALQADELDNVAGAISSLNRVLRTAPNHIPTLQYLAQLYQRDGQWNEAVNLLSRVVQLAPEREALRDTHLELASLWGERLGETPRALVSLQAVLALDPANRRALEQLAELQRREGRLGKAAEAATRLVEMSEEPKSRAAALLHVARIEQERGREEEARQALHRALAIEGPGGEAALTYKSTLDTPRDWEDYVDALEQHMAAGGDPGRAHLEIARVRFDHQGQPNAAITALEQAREHSEDASIRLEIASRLRLAGRSEGAIQELQRLANQDVTRLEAWRELARALVDTDRPEEARRAVEPLVLFGAATGPERQLLDAHPPRPGHAHTERLDAGLLRQLAGFTEAQNRAAELLTNLEPGLPKLFPPDLDAFGLANRDRVTTRSGHPVRLLADRVGAVVGAGPFELFLHRVRSRGVAVECGNPPVVLVPAAIAELPETQQVFMLARPLVGVALRFYVMEKLTPRELEVLLACAARSVAPQHGSGLTSEDFLDAQARRIHKALSRRARKAMEQAATSYVEGPRVDFPRWTDNVRLVCNRLSALVADDLSACVAVMRQAERETGTADAIGLARSSPAVADLLGFWASHAASDLRRHLGLLPEA